MEYILNFILESLDQTKDAFIYLFLFLSAVIENLFPPVPGDTITAFGAFLVGTGRLDYFYVYFVTTTGSVVGFMTLFLLGKHYGRKYFMERDFRIFPASSIQKTEDWADVYGYWLVLANRFLPGIRSVISIVSGIAKLNTFIVFLISLLSASIWNLIWIHTGYMLGNNWDIVKDRMGSILRQYNIAAGALIILIIVIIIYRKKKK